MGQMKVIETTLRDVVMIYDRSGEPIAMQAWELTIKDGVKLL